MRKNRSIKIVPVWYKLTKGNWGCPGCSKFCLVQSKTKPTGCLIRRTK